MELIDEYVCLRIRRYRKQNPKSDLNFLIMKLLSDKDFRINFVISLAEETDTIACVAKVLRISERNVNLHIQKNPKLQTKKFKQTK